MSRRDIFGVAAGAAAAASVTPALAQGVTPVVTSPPLRIGYGQPAARFRPTFVKDLSRLIDLNPNNQGAAYWNLKTYITPVDDFYVRNEYPTPRPETDKRVDARSWRLKIHGNGIERPIEISYDDLLKMPSRCMISTMECAGNGRSLFWEQQGMLEKPEQVGGTGWGFGGIGQAEWQFVPMSHILGLVGLKKAARHALFWSGVDGKTPGTQSDTGRPVPIETLTSRGQDCGLAFQMNGKDLLPDHGAPVRALIPGWCGAASTKWLTEIKIASHNFWVPLNSFRHVMIGQDYPAPKPKPGDEFRFVQPDGVRGPMVTWCPPRSMLSMPLVLEKQPKHPHNYPLQPGERPKLVAGRQKLHGYAWAPRSGVSHVDLNVDGRGWQRARILDRQPNRYTWVRFEMPTELAAGRHVIATRTTDKAGLRQPDSVAFNEGGFDFWAVPKFHVDVA